MKYKFCQKCGALNRVDSEKIAAKTPACGKCSAELTHLEAADHLSEAQIEKLIRNSDRLVVVDVYADWCGPCKVYSPVFTKVGEQNYKKAEFVKLNTDQARKFSARFGIRGVPATLFFKNGKLLNNQGGLLSETQLSQEVQALS
ncbi:MAG: thioredoxin [Bacteriovoracaceae bacterium]